MMHKISAVMIDIDQTITDNISSSNDTEFRNGIFNIITKALSVKRNISIDEANDIIFDYANSLVWWDYPDFITDFDLDYVEIWQAMRDLHSKLLMFYEDAIDMVTYLKAKNLPIYIISNNPVTGCLLKLERAGLASLSGESEFVRIFGTNILRGQKNMIPTWKRCIANLNVDPSQIVTIGDNKEQDYRIPQKAGIGFSIIIDREVRQMEKKPSHILINTLKDVSKIL
jgi:FMN phosphatase YigB (HAD superfamily)